MTLPEYLEPNRSERKSFSNIFIWGKKLILLFLFVSLIGFISASSVAVWQGQYYTGTTFNTGTYTFNFTVYDSLAGGNICFTNTTNLITGNWGEWKAEQNPWTNCDNASKEYFLNINVAGTDETPRRRLTVADFLRRDVEEIKGGNLVVNENVTANYFLGNGSFLTGVGGGGDINEVNTAGAYLSGGQTSGSVSLLFNETKLNETIDAKSAGGDNSSWNESLADSLYIAQNNEVSLNVNSSVYSNSTTWWASVSSWLSGWFVNNGGFLEFNESRLNNTIDARGADGDNSSWNQSYANTLYINFDGDNMSGDLNMTTSTIYIQDDQNESHNMKSHISRVDTLLDDVILDEVEITTSNNGTHTTVILTSITGEHIRVNLDKEVRSFDSSSINATLINGVNSSPQENNVVILNENILTLQVLTSHPVHPAEHIDVAIYQIGDNGAIKGFNAATYQLYEAVHGSMHRIRHTGPSYISGFDANVTTTEFNHSSGESMIIYKIISCEDLTMANGFFYVNSSGGWVYGTDLSVFTEYSDGTVISSGKFMPLIAGVIPLSDTTCQLVFVPSGYPGAGKEYKNCKESEEDLKQVRDVFPADQSIKLEYTPTTWILLDADNDEFCAFASGDFSRKIAGDVTSGGGAPTSPSTDNSSWNESLANTLYLNLSGTNANQDVNIGSFNFVASNLTLRDKITFGLGEIVDNIIDGWVRIMGGLNVTGDAVVAGNVTIEGIFLEQDITNHRIYDNSTCVIITGDTSTMYIC